jgi:hypothetical protein
MRDELVTASVIILLILQGWLYVHLIQGIRRNKDAPNQTFRRKNHEATHRNRNSRQRELLVRRDT